MPRKTIKNSVYLAGTGLHTGTLSKVIFHPARGTGLRFIGKDFDKPVRALLASVSGTVRGTNISDGKHIIHTVEHLICSAVSLDIDDLDVEIIGEEPPICDGSAKEFAEVLLSAGFQETEGNPDIKKLTKPLEAQFGLTTYKAMPAKEGLTISAAYENPHKLIGRQQIELKITPESFLKEIAPARTFGYDFEVESLKKAGLAKGGSLDNALVITDKEILAKDGLRFNDEPVRHKLLDFLGDMALMGFRLDCARIETVRPGHSGNVNFAKLLLNTLERE